MTRLNQTDVCLACGMPYLVSEGHACSGPRSLAPDTKTAPAVGTPEPLRKPHPVRGRTRTMRKTLAENPVLDQPPSPATPPQRPPEDDRELALIWIMGGRTSADAAAMAAGISSWAARRTSAAAGEIEESAAVRKIREEDERLVSYLEVMLDELAADRLAAANRLAADMAELETQGWTPEMARAALAAQTVPAPRKPVAAA